MEALSDVLAYRWLTFKSNDVAKYEITIHSVNKTHPYYSWQKIRNMLNGVKWYSTDYEQKKYKDPKRTELCTAVNGVQNIL